MTSLTQSTKTAFQHMADLAQRFLREEEGQSTVEYMLLISVIVVAIVAAAFVFLEPLTNGIEEFSQKVQEILTTGKIGAVGTAR